MKPGPENHLGNRSYLTSIDFSLHSLQIFRVNFYTCTVRNIIIYYPNLIKYPYYDIGILTASQIFATQEYYVKKILKKEKKNKFN